MRAGTFEDLFLGDHWVINGITWRIVDIDYWYGQGAPAFMEHHLVIMPDPVLYNASMNDTDTSAGGYIGSNMYTTGLERAKTIIGDAFGSAVLTHREYLVNAVANGGPSALVWCDSSVELPNEIMMYGSYVYATANNGTTVPALGTTGKTQLALMQTLPKFINQSRETQWLRDVVSATRFALVGNFGVPNDYPASYSFGVRPVFPVG